METGKAVEEFLEHHGVKGMRWGVRRSFGGGRSSGSGPKSLGPVKMGGKAPWHSPPPKKSEASKGRLGKGKSPKIVSEEAKQLHAIRLKVKKNGIHSLSNKELETVNKRLELQSKYQKANPKKKNPLVDLALDAILSDHGSKKITEYMGKKVASGKIHPQMVSVVEAAITFNRVTRQTKK